MNLYRRTLETELNELFEIEATLEAPNNLDFGDYATPAALEEANRNDRVPREYAQQMLDTLPLDEFEFLDKAEVAGPGYINFHLDRKQLGAEILSETSDLGFEDKDEKILIEHTSPNPNKPLHMGTMRCAILGDTIARIADYLGYDVEIHDYINDLGRQSATAVYAYQEFLDELSEEDKTKKADYWIGVLYSLAAQHLEEHPDDDVKVQTIIQDIEEQDNENFELMRETVEQSLHGQLETAHRSNIQYDLLAFETDVVASGLFEKAMSQLQDLDTVYEVTDGDDKGCLVIELGEYEDVLGEMKKPYKVLVRSDGTATYTAKDIALTLWKFGVIDSDFTYEAFTTRPDGKPVWSTSTNGELRRDFGNADTVINVIGSPQKYPMQVIEFALQTLGFDYEAENFHHLDFKYVYLAGDALPGDAQKEKVAYSGRKGNWKGKHGDAVLDKAKELAIDEIQQRHPNKSLEGTIQLAETIAVAAVRYFLLRFTRKKDVEFSFEKVMDWEGDSGPYLLYSTVRAYSILEGVDIDPEFTTFEEDLEIELLHKIDEFKLTVEESFEVQDPARLAHYLRKLAEIFSSFYHKCHVQQAKTEELKRSRTAITQGFLAVMEDGLGLLGIEPVETL